MTNYRQGKTFTGILLKLSLFFLYGRFWGRSTTLLPDERSKMWRHEVPQVSRSHNWHLQVFFFSFIFLWKKFTAKNDPGTSSSFSSSPFFFFNFLFLLLFLFHHHLLLLLRLHVVFFFISLNFNNSHLITKLRSRCKHAKLPLISIALALLWPAVYNHET